MQTTLFVDAGNTTVKIAVFRNDDWEILARIPVSDFCKISFPTIFSDYQDAFWVVCSVVTEVEELVKTNIPEENAVIMDVSSVPSHLIAYETPQTLGLDRLMAGLGAWVSEQKSVLVIDSGTACTIDFVDDTGKFCGGVIMPGLQSMGRALNEFTSKLPKPDLELPQSWPPKSTMDALRAGANESFFAAIKEHIRRFKEMAPEAQVLVSGGDSKWIARHLKEVRTARNLVFDGMKYVLENRNKTV